MPDKERLVKLLVEYGITDKYIDDLCDEIEECFADELEKARLWDRVKEMRTCADIIDCPENCKFLSLCEQEAKINCMGIGELVDALEKEPR